MKIVIGPDWKSTAAGILSFALVTLGSLSAFLGSLAAASPKPNYTITFSVAAVAFLTGLARAWVGWLQMYVQAEPTSAPTALTVVNIPTTPVSSLPAAAAVTNKTLGVLLAVMVSFAMLGCAAKPAPLPNGAINSIDSGLNANLQAVHAGLAQYEADVNAGLHTVTATERSLINKVILSLNQADVLYQSYHARLKNDPTIGESAELAAALAAVTDNLSTLQASAKEVKQP